MTPSDDPHPDAAESTYKDLRFDDPAVQKRQKVQADNFEYGLQSMEDVELTLETDDPTQDERDVAGWWASVRGKVPR